ncbi:MAG TPA: tRNA1(Val) (adenine(37)-N6)-methyltransferase [Methylomusa anaerophila]|uniref:N5-glutamine S-adenosyl-L-methionine-dependent methyltransferase n=1 Tax=Methylomusa anaerophila TaxID=1930071 RepID=A0A348AGY0_9FIRM|nr:tRNA1(Val) (adenine(37)-N6)-methyltransferase [Methylomusa anaerophila]BBB90328.1 N5-glutamine S-adenosyl-L-methionine-dependent methyltransferase [Methylomusa anaerophila]HML89326.1 tRNA1(Val) (adenine(37)-N6)-methyltransferase [Methylomusa anaerophila]
MDTHLPQTCLKPGERLDNLIIKGYRIIQHEAEFCFSLDAILLAHFATLRPGGTAVDLGAGTGVISLLLNARGAGKVVGIEISPAMSDMAARSVAVNGLGEQIKIMQGDLRRMRELLPGGEWELVVSNPPYRLVGGGFISPNDRVAMARHEVTANLSDVVNAARFLMKFRGRFAMVHLPERLSDIMYTMREAGIEPKRLQLVYPRIDKKPNMLLVEGVRGANPGIDVLPPLIVYDAGGKYTNDIVRLYGGEKAFRLK